MNNCQLGTDCGLVAWVLRWVSDVVFLVPNGKQALHDSSTGQHCELTGLIQNGLLSILSLLNRAVVRSSS